MKKKITLLILLAAVPLMAGAFDLPTGRAWTTQTLVVLFDNIADLLIWIGVTGAVITLVYAGILYFTSGFNAKAVENAKGIIKNAIWGIVLVVGFGVIINTITAVITGDFFGAGGENNNSSNNGALPQSDDRLITGGDAGESCLTGNVKCQQGLTCLTRFENTNVEGNVCVRAGGNYATEGCLVGGDCRSGLACVNNRCLKLRQEGETCTDSNQCAGELACKDSAGKLCGAGSVRGEECFCKP